MVKYVAKRIGYMLFVLLVVTTITFFLMHNIPGDPLTALVQTLPEQTKPIIMQNMDWTNQYLNSFSCFSKVFSHREPWANPFVIRAVW